jgi:hypothetical protein
VTLLHGRTAEVLLLSSCRPGGTCPDSETWGIEDIPLTCRVLVSSARQQPHLSRLIFGPLKHLWSGHSCSACPPAVAHKRGGDDVTVDHDAVVLIYRQYPRHYLPDIRTIVLTVERSSVVNQ